MEERSVRCICGGYGRGRAGLAFGTSLIAVVPCCRGAMERVPACVGAELGRRPLGDWAAKPLATRGWTGRGRGEGQRRDFAGYRAWALAGSGPCLIIQGLASRQ